MKNVRRQTELPSLSPLPNAATQVWRERLWENLINDYPHKFVRILFDAGFERIRVHKEPYHPVWAIRMRLGQYPWPATNAEATRHLRQKFRENEIKVPANSFSASREGNRVLIALVYATGDEPPPTQIDDVDMDMTA